MKDFAHLLSDPSIDLTELRERLRAMSDRELRKFGEATRYMCERKKNAEDPAQLAFVIQLEEARAEWRRRQRLKGKM